MPVPQTAVRRGSLKSAGNLLRTTVHSRAITLSRTTKERTHGHVRNRRFIRWGAGTRSGGRHFPTTSIGTLVRKLESKVKAGRPVPRRGSRSTNEYPHDPRRNCRFIRWGAAGTRPGGRHFSTTSIGTFVQKLKSKLKPNGEGEKGRDGGRGRGGQGTVCASVSKLPSPGSGAKVTQPLLAVQEK